MNKTWFHHCLSGMLSLSAIRRDDLRAFTEAHPYQANIQFVHILKNGQARTPKQAGGTGEFLGIPDRRALFREWHTPKGEEKDPAGHSVATGQAHGNLPATGETTGRQAQSLPVYIPELVATAEMESVEDELADLESRLLADWQWDESGPVDEVPADQESGPADTSDKTTRLPVMSRFDPSLGTVEQEPSPHAFLGWLHTLRHLVPEQAEESDDVLSERVDAEPEIKQDSGDALPLTEEPAPLKIVEPAGTEAPTSARIAKPELPEEKESRKKKRKKKKLARKLAKTSVKQSEEVATETLAALLARQGHTDQAIVMYQKLSLLIPEKKAIFAGQIAKLKQKDP